MAISKSEARLAVVKDLVEFSRGLEQLGSQVRQFEWDYSGETVHLLRKHVVKVLQRYLSGELSAEDVEEWADLLEMREDVDF